MAVHANSVLGERAHALSQSCARALLHFNYAFRSAVTLKHFFAGVRQDLTQAVAWYKIAAQQHNARAEAVMRLYEVLFPPLRARACKDV